MTKVCKERHAGRGNPRSSGLTPQTAGQMTEAVLPASSIGLSTHGSVVIA